METQIHLPPICLHGVDRTPLPLPSFNYLEFLLSDNLRCTKYLAQKIIIRVSWQTDIHRDKTKYVYHTADD
jgi:hypothetical protein